MDWLKRLSQKVPGHDAPAEAMPPVTLRDLRIPGKIFSLAMQPQAAGSIAPFLARWSLGGTDAAQTDWARAWFDGNHEAIVASPAFAAADVHEGAPFWFPDFYKYLHHRIPGSRFVLMLAEPDAWFRAMVASAGGFAEGDPEVHAKVFRREDELRWLRKNIPGFTETGRLMLHDSAGHYKAAYARHVGAVQDFFQARKTDSLFVGRQDDPASLQKLAQWLRLPGAASVGQATAGDAAAELTKDGLLKPAGGAGSPAGR